MKIFKFLSFGLLISFLFIKADCNKVDETPIDDGYFIEGRLVNSCTDNTPIRNTIISLAPKIYVKEFVVSSQTDSNGYFKIKTNYPSGFMSLDFENSQLITNIPAGKSINIGNVVLVNVLSFNVMYNNFSNLTKDDSLIIYTNNGILVSPRSDLTVKGPFNSKYIQTIKINTGAIYSGDTTATGKILLYKNSLTNLIGEKKYVATNCGNPKDIIFE